MKQLSKRFKTNYKKKKKKKKQINKKLPKNNLTKNQIEAFKDLSIKHDIIITEAHKGRAVVIIDVDDSINETNDNLTIKSFTKKFQMTQRN